MALRTRKCQRSVKNVNEKCIKMGDDKKNCIFYLLPKGKEIEKSCRCMKE